jgi:hypothetical protein
MLTLAGANLLAIVVVVPGLWAGHPVVALVPIAALVAAVMRPRDALLFGAFPAALALAATLQPDATALLSRAPALVLAIAAAIAYLFIAARQAAHAEAAELPTHTPSPLTPAEHLPPPGRLLFLFALAGPAVLLWAAVLRPGAAADLAAHHADRPSAGALAVCAAAALWVGLVVVYVRSALPKSGEDKRLRTELWALKAALRRGRATKLFYGAVIAALAGMAALVYLRYR